MAVVLVVKVVAIYVAVGGTVGVMYTRQATMLLLGRSAVAPSGGGGTMATATATAAGKTSTSTDSKDGPSAEEQEEIGKLEREKSMLLDRIDVLESKASAVQPFGKGSS